jgi:hypothetical protein
LVSFLGLASPLRLEVKVSCSDLLLPWLPSLGRGQHPPGIKLTLGCIRNRPESLLSEQQYKSWLNKSITLNQHFQEKGLLHANLQIL